MRAFLALDLPADIIAYLRGVIGRLDKRTEGVRWVRDEGIHITVKFLGEIEEARGEEMREVLAPIGARIGPFPARLGALDAFPTRRSARVVVVRLKEGVEQSQAIFSEVEERLSAIQVERERRGFAPHITLGRRRIPKPFPNGDPMPIEERGFVIERLVLYKSTLTPGGAIYAPVWRIKLGGEDR
ncbi:MAG: RNA 2',3'-cyclic phosphodiesterase [Syntrophorhabdales bacterium]